MDIVWKRICKGILLAMLLLGVAVISSCHEDEEQQLTELVDSFSISYFNWRFQQAVPYCTDDSKPWLRYAAAQVHQADIDILKAMDQGAEVERGNIAYKDSGDTATVEVAVRNFLQMDTIGNAGQLVDEARFLVPLVRQEGQWKVRLSGVLRQQ